MTSLACAPSRNIQSLIAFCVMQGFTAGLSMPTMQTILISSAGKAQATQAMTVVGLPAVIVPVLGPLLGGFLLDKVRW
ncbi:MFS transporter [Propionibacterium sp. NM47_B9-13]|nr:MFS transporter [Cutibacterium modestum]REB74469.1 MFS transporter [Cutibacterium modestum]TGY27966.1 MFS transporter [Propionibacterium sp. NM47_B9-13]